MLTVTCVFIMTMPAAQLMQVFLPRIHLQTGHERYLEKLKLRIPGGNIDKY